MYKAKEEEQHLRYVFDLLMALDEQVPWYTGYVFEGLTLTRKSGGWFLVVRAKRGGGERVVTFHANRKLFYVWLSFGIELTYQRLKWSVDKFAK